jgi:hypothetical protein
MTEAPEAPADVADDIGRETSPTTTPLSKHLQRRERELLDAMSGLINAYKAWECDEDDGGPQRRLFQNLIAADTKTVLLWAADLCPPSLVPLVGVVEQLAIKLAKWLEDATYGGRIDFRTPPHQLMFGEIPLIDKVLRKMETPAPRLETVAELLEQKCTPEQIAKTLGVTRKQVDDEHDAIDAAYAKARLENRPWRECFVSTLPPDFKSPEQIRIEQERAKAIETHVESNGVALSVAAAKIQQFYR